MGLKKHWLCGHFKDNVLQIISDEIEDTDDGTAEDEETKDESNADIVPSVPALQSENPDEKEACPVCR